MAAASSSFLSPSSQFISTPKFSAPSPPLSPPSSSVTFRQSSQRISASHTSTAERITSPPSSMYELLGINMGASSQEIKAAYRRLARVSHPDVATKERNDSPAAAADEFIRIHAAYATLSDPGKRAEYDRTLFSRQRRPAVTTSSRYSGYTTGRNWETDQCW